MKNNESKVLELLKELGQKHKCFENAKVISMFMAMYEYIENTKASMFDLNSYSNTANVKNTEQMAKNYSAFVFLLENFQTLNKQELEKFLSAFKWDGDLLIIDFIDLSLVKLRFFHYSNYDFTGDQLTLI